MLQRNEIRQMCESRFQNWSCGLPGENISALGLHFPLKFSTTAPNTFFETRDARGGSWVAAVAQRHFCFQAEGACSL